jgi:hypothetical protein
MALNTEVASPSADSYCTVAEADTYLAGITDRFDTSDWDALSDTQKEQRLKLAAQILDTAIPFRGVSATKAQALKWPRIFPGEDLYVDDDNPLENSFDTWTDLTDYADLLGMEEADYPGIPDEVKWAQIEIAYQVVHSYLFTIGPFETGTEMTTDFSIEGIRFKETMKEVAKGGLFEKYKFDSMSIVRFYLGRYITSLRMTLL